MIVPDASVVLELLLRTQYSTEVESALFDSKESLHAPHLLDLEVLQVLRRYLANGDIKESRAREAVADLLDLPIIRYPHRLLVPRIWELRGNLTAYDGAYVALAELLEASLVTRDQRLANAPGSRARVRVI